MRGEKMNDNNPSSFSFADVRRNPFFSIPRCIRWSVFWTSKKIRDETQENDGYDNQHRIFAHRTKLSAWEVRSTHDRWRAHQSTPSAFHTVVATAWSDPQGWSRKSRSPPAQ